MKRSSSSTHTAGFLALILVFLTAASGMYAQQQTRWAGYLLQHGSYVTTPDAFLGGTYVGIDGWIYSTGIGAYFHLPEDYVEASGAWAYAISFEEEVYNPYYADVGWLYARNSGAWVWVYDSANALSAGHGWAYIHYGEPEPDSFAVTGDFTAEPPVGGINLPDYTNARPADAEELERFANALHIGVGEIGEHVEIDRDVTMERGEDGITFTSIAGFGNRFVRLFYHPLEVGLLDLSALEGVTGEIGVTVRGSVDLSADTGGFYCRIMNNGIADEVNATPGIPDHVEEFLLDLRDVGAASRLEKGALYEDVLLETYTNQPVDAAFIEFTLPPQGSITVKDIYLHMESEIRGFADIAERITGGEGASEENTHTVTNVYEMLDALEAVKNVDGPSIIYVDGLLHLDDWEEAGGEPQQFNISGSVRNFSLIGVGNNAILDGIGLKVHGTNIIIENLTIRNAWMQDGVEINDARYVLVTRCTMHGNPATPDLRFDEFMSVKNQARYVIIAWNHLRDDVNGRGILVGSNDGVGALPNRSLIIHHNWFENTGSRHPLVRGGYTHIYNNYFDNVRWGTNVRTRAKVRIENNYFLNVDRAIFPGEEPPSLAGAWEVSGNIYDGGNEDHQPDESTITLDFESDYTYTLDDADDVRNIVMAGAGAGNTE